MFGHLVIDCDLLYSLLEMTCEYLFALFACVEFKKDEGNAVLHGSVLDCGTL